MKPELALKIVRKAFNGFDKNNMGVLDDFYASQAVFQDPVVKVKGLEQISSYYASVYNNVKEIRFDFQDVYATGNRFAMPWVMTLKVKGLNFGAPYSVEGLSVFEFNDESKVIFHRDYVDLGAMVYERIPVFGKIISGIRKRLSHG